jgi:hypothetical protein
MIESVTSAVRLESLITSAIAMRNVLRVVEKGAQVC